jgi:hypothetical protein
VNLLKVIYLTLVHLIKQAMLFPQTVANAFRKKRQGAVVSEYEVERLDRLRNPSKYKYQEK